MPFPRPAARPWGGFDAAFELPLPLRFGGGGINKPPPPNLKRLVLKAHAAERAAALAYRGHRCCFRRPEDRRLVHQLAMDEWRHRAWLRRTLMPALGIRPNPFLEAIFLVVGMLITLACLVIGPFLATYFAGRLERDNGEEYDQVAQEVQRLRHIGSTEQWRLQMALQHMAVAERRHERDLFRIIRHHPWLPKMVPPFQWPLRTPLEGKSPRRSNLPLANIPLRQVMPWRQPSMYALS